MTAKCIFSLALFLGLVGAAHALDNAKTKKCSLMSQIASDVVNDRDRGVKYEARVAKNRKLAAGMPTLHEFMANLTKAVYFDLKGRPKLEIANATFYACMQTEE